MLEVILGGLSVGTGLLALWLWNRLKNTTGHKSDYERMIEYAVKENEALMGRVDEMGIQITGMQSQVGFLQDELGDKKGEINALTDEIDELTEENEEIGEEAKKQKGRAASAHTTKGLILEKWCPFLNHPEIDESWEPKDWVFMGQPIDYIIFDWDEDSDKNRTDGRIVMLDVKSGKSQLTKKQRRIRDLVKAGKVEWREIRLV